MALLRLVTAVKHHPIDDVFKGPETCTHINTPSNIWVSRFILQNTLYLLSVYDQTCNLISSNHIHSPNILSKDGQNDINAFFYIIMC